MQPNIKWITHNGKEILYNNRQGYNEDEIIESVMAARDIIMNSGKKDILYLVNSTDNYIVKKVKDTIKQVGKELDPYIKKTAVIGLTVPQQLLINLFNSITSLNIKVFSSLHEAKEWLTQ